VLHLVQTVVLVNNISDLNTIPRNFLKYNNNAKIFSFGINVHNELESRDIKHEIADNFLNENERLEIFDKVTEFRYWHEQLSSSDYNLDGINILKIPDSHEFHSFLMPYLIDFLLVKRIIDNENPIEIISTTSLSKSINAIIKGKKIKTIFFDSEIISKLFWEKVTVKFNIGKIPLSITLSDKRYLQIKNFLETVYGNFYNFWFDTNKSKKKSIVFLEFNPEPFSKLLKEMNNFDGNVILVNQRRTPIWSKKSRDAIKNSKCKILKLENILDKKERQEIPLLVDKYSKKLEILWENSDFLRNLFKIEDCSFWDVIRDTLIQTYSKRLSRYISLIKSVKKFLDTTNIQCIVSLNEIGETEKTFLEVNKNKIRSIVLEHGFLERIPKTKRFDIIGDYVRFKDLIAVWGENKRKWLIEEHNIDPNRILVTGSPRHDTFFNSRIKKQKTNIKTLLLAPNPLSEISGLSSTEIKLRFNAVIKQVFSIIENIDNVKLIVKLHPADLKHNDEIKSLIKKLDPSVPILLWTSVIDTLNNVDATLVISPEIYGTSTMLLESMILGKPTMNVFFDEQVPQFGHVKAKAVLTITDSCDLESNLRKILFDEKFQTDLCNNADNFINTFMSNTGTASQKFTSILRTLD